MEAKRVEWYIYHRLSIGRVQGLEDPPGDFSRPPAGSGRPLLLHDHVCVIFPFAESFRIVSQRIVSCRGVASRCRDVTDRVVSTCVSTPTSFVLRKTTTDHQSCATVKPALPSKEGSLVRGRCSHFSQGRRRFATPASISSPLLEAIFPKFRSCFSTESPRETPSRPRHDIITTC